MLFCVSKIARVFLVFERYNIIIVPYIYFSSKTIPLCSSLGSSDFAYTYKRQKIILPWVIFRVIINHLKSTWKMEIRRGKQEREGVALKVPFKRLCACNLLIDSSMCQRRGHNMREERRTIMSEVEMNECQKLNWYSTNNEEYWSAIPKNSSFVSIVP